MSQNNMPQNNNMFFWVIIVLLIIIAILAFFVGKGASSETTDNNSNNNTNNSTQTQATGLLGEAQKLGLDIEAINECKSSDTYSARIAKHQEIGSNTFGVTGTPGNVLINNKTGEYTVISGAYPTTSFIEAIDSLLAEWPEKESDEAVSNEEINLGSESELTVTVIDDKRCTNCSTDLIIGQLQSVEGFTEANFQVFDYSNPNAQAILTENNIQKLPAVILSNDDLIAEMKQFVSELPSGVYSLAVWAAFDPTADRSDKWFLIVSQETIDAIKAESYIKGNPDATITWLEYSDLECPFCAKLHNSSTPEELTQKYGDDLNIIYNHFPLDFHPKAIPGAKFLECAAEQWGSEVFYKLLDISYEKGIQE